MTLHRGVVINTLVSINEVTLSQLVFDGSPSIGGKTISVCNQLPKSTQPSSLRGTVRWLSAFGLSNDNKWRWWMQFTGCLCSWACGSSQFSWSKGQRPLGPVLYSSVNSQWLCHDDSTVNVLLVIVIIIVLFKLMKWPVYLWHNCLCCSMIGINVTR